MSEAEGEAESAVEAAQEAPEADQARLNRTAGEPLFIVGMGGSAGSLEAFEQFFRNMPVDSGLAFVLVSHLDPTHKGMMPELLQRFTAMPVRQAEDGLKVQANAVYVIPPDRDLSILHGSLELLEPTAPRGLRLPIDFFFRQLADDQRERSICAIFSGMGSDGTLGLRAVKEKLGMAMVQDLGSAQYDSMPRSALDTGLVDYVASADQLPGRLMGYVRHYSKAITKDQPVEAKAGTSLQKIFVLLRAETGHDFSLYKSSTIRRRIERRMSVHQISAMTRYVRYLQENPHEIELLFKELLIGVTNFFRDPEAFEALKEIALPPLLRARSAAQVFRVWVPGCSTGEEAYSLAMVIRECLDTIKPPIDPKVVIYATDIDREAVEKARQGFYLANVAADVSPERLRRFFLKDGSGYRIKPEIRHQLVFAPQNLIMDPPLTRLDLLSCRNLLIYLAPELQRTLLPMFHYALSPGGILLLGSAETAGGSTDLFTTIDSRWKVFVRRESATARAMSPELPSAMPLHRLNVPGPPRRKKLDPVVSLSEVVQQIVVETVAPPVVLVNDRGDIVYSTSRTGKYLEPSVGKANLNILAMAREGLRAELGMALRRAVMDQAEVGVAGVRVKTNGKTQVTHLTVRPLKGPEAVQGLFMVVFEDATPAWTRRAARAKTGAGGVLPDQRLEGPEAEVLFAREQMQTATEEMQGRQEEYRSANEELQSANMELQSANEELTSSREEMQSLSEELLTLNAELQTKNLALVEVGDDMRNLINSTEIATIFLDGQFKIKRFTHRVTEVFRLIQADVGRPLGDISSNLTFDTGELLTRAERVAETLVPDELRVGTRDGRNYTVRIMPYRTTEDRISGVVITFVDVSGSAREPGALPPAARNAGDSA